jgi:CubicO group peptidase (beta-lactamase class C family)
LRSSDRLGGFIPWLGEPLASVTIRDVLNHAAGIVRDGYESDYWQLRMPFPDAAQLRRLVENGGDVLPANRLLKYSNIGYSLLGLVIEAASGMPYNRYMQEEIVNRLGLASTGPETSESIGDRLVTGYTSRELLLPRTPLPDAETGAMSPATGFHSTAEDLTRFAAAHFFGDRTLIGDTSRRAMFRAYWPLEDMDSYGLGLQMLKVSDRWLGGHGGSFPGHSTRTAFDPDERLAIAVLTNESNGRAGTLVKSAVEIIDLAGEQGEIEGAEDLDRYTGRFASPWGFVDIARLGNALFLLSPDEDSPAAEALRLEVLAGDTLRIEEKPGYGSPGETIRYARDADDKVESISLAGRTHHPVDDLDAYLEERRQELASLGR